MDMEEKVFDTKVMEKHYKGFYNKVVKRVIDFLLALILTIVLSPVMLIIALLILIETGAPVFYRPYRGGYKDKKFRIFKFRTMVKNADKIGGGTTALNDSRITKIGKFLRKTKLDEIPQLLNILSGTMSFIGPRPELLRYTDAYDEMEKNILNVRPGITDYSSIEFINLDEIVGGDNADEMYEKYVLKKKNALRLKYVATVSLGTDFKLFFKTIGKVIKKAFKVIFGKKQKENAMQAEAASTETESGEKDTQNVVQTEDGVKEVIEVQDSTNKMEETFESASQTGETDDGIHNA